MSRSVEPLRPDSPSPGSAAAWLEAVRFEERRGELLAAFDLAERGLAEHPDELKLKHRAVLALARAGATEEAARRFHEYGLAGIAEEDIASLRARIAKDVALGAEGSERAHRAARAVELYHAVFARTGSYYPAVNAATLWLWPVTRTARESWRALSSSSSPLPIAIRITLPRPRRRPGCSWAIRGLHGKRSSVRRRRTGATMARSPPPGASCE